MIILPNCNLKTFQKFNRMKIVCKWKRDSKILTLNWCWDFIDSIQYYSAAYFRELISRKISASSDLSWIKIKMSDTATHEAEIAAKAASPVKKVVEAEPSKAGDDAKTENGVKSSPIKNGES